MPATRFLPRLTPWLVIAAGLTLGAGTVFADINGRTGKAQSANGCNCHGTSKSTGVTVTITGPQSVTAGSSNAYTVTVSGGPTGSAGGFDLKASAGALTAGSNNSVSGLDVTHANGASRSWTFTWTAPATAGTENFWAIGLAANGSSDTANDQWNWYGGAANTAFPITVVSSAGVGNMGTLTFLASPAPNPCVNGTQVAFSLASAAPARVEIFDAAGRRVRTLVQGTLAAGAHTTQWDRRAGNGTRVSSGVYFVHLATPQQTLVRRVTVTD